MLPLVPIFYRRRAIISLPESALSIHNMTQCESKPLDVPSIPLPRSGGAAIGDLADGSQKMFFPAIVAAAYFVMSFVKRPYRFTQAGYLYHQRGKLGLGGWPF
jgi:hypothetical protein